MKTPNSVLPLLALAGLLALTLAGCGGAEPETLGDQVQQAAEETGEAMQDAADEMKDSAEDLGEEMKEAGEEVKEEAEKLDPSGGG